VLFGGGKKGSGSGDRLKGWYGQLCLGIVRSNGWIEGILQLPGKGLE
jgi:hypothetical protein